MTVPGIIFRMWFEINVLFVSLMPMTMETRCSNVFFQKYSKKKSAEDTLVPPIWEKRGENFFLLVPYLFARLHAAELALANLKPRGTAFLELNYAGEACGKIRKPTR